MHEQICNLTDSGVQRGLQNGTVLVGQWGLSQSPLRSVTDDVCELPASICLSERVMSRCCPVGRSVAPPPPVRAGDGKWTASM